MSRLWSIAVVGAAGSVGAQIIECLEERDFPVDEVKILAVGKGDGEGLVFCGDAVAVEALTHDSFEGVDIAIFAADAACSQEFIPAATKAGAVCIDNSGVWGSEKGVPFVIPEVNPGAVADYKHKGVIANPSCSTIQLLAALKPLHDFAKIKRIVVSTYQAVSGSGDEAIDELRIQTGELLNGRPAENKVYPHRIAFNCLPQVDAFCDNDYTVEEMKLVDETAKIMGAGIRTTATCVRVPVFFGLSESVNIETEKKITAAKARELLRHAPGVELVDDPGESEYPMAMDAAGEDAVLVGRIREDASIENGLNLWIVADNVRKGAATNAVQIAEILVEKYLK